MLRRHDEARLNFRFGHTGKDARKVQHKFRGRVIDDGEVGVNAFRLFFAKLEIDIDGLGSIIRHNRFLVC